MHSLTPTLLLTTCLLTQPGDPIPQVQTPRLFLINETGLALLDRNGKEKHRFRPFAACGALSPNGRRLAYTQNDVQTRKPKLVLHSLDRKTAPTKLPMVWGQVGTGCLPVWSADGKRLFVGKEGFDKNRQRDFAYRIYDLATKKFTAPKLPAGVWVTGWSRDGKKLLATVRGDGRIRVAWLTLDGRAKPEYITPATIDAYGAKLSPDGRRIMCMAAPRGKQGDTSRPRLCVIDLATKKRTVIEQPTIAEAHNQIHQSDWAPLNSSESSHEECQHGFSH